MSGLASIEAVKQGIAKEYFKNVVVIDDDCYDQFSWEKGEIKVNKLYEKFYKECIESDINCHLQYFPKEAKKDGKNISDEDKERYIKLAVNHALNGEIIILDWHLGLENEYEYSEDILTRILADNKLKFILIYTEFTENIYSILESQLNFKKLGAESGAIQEESETFIPEDKIISSESSNTMNIFKRDNILLCVVKKDKEVKENGKVLIEIAYKLMSDSFPDLIHWAGFEISNYISKNISDLVSRIPAGTNPAIVMQSFYTAMPNEMSDWVSKIYLDHFNVNLETVPLKILSDEIIKPLIPVELYQGEEEKENSYKERIKKYFKNKSSEFRIMEDDLFDENSHNVFSFLQECYINTENPPEYLRRGTILYNEENGKYLLCIVQDCDLYRIEEGDKIYFISGYKLQNSQKTNKGYYVQSFVGEKVFVQWSTLEIIDFQISQTITGFPPLDIEELKVFSYIGRMKESFVDRILQRTWAKQNRVGVNLPEYVRRLREEK